MNSRRIVLAVAAFAGIAASWAAAPVASAEITSMKVYGHYSGMYVVPTWMITITTTDCYPVRFFDNGTPIPGSSVSRPNCEPGVSAPVSVSWYPTTRGNHHIVAEQRDADGNVINSRSADFTVDQIPCLPEDTLLCSLGSADGAGAWTGSFNGGGSFQRR
ncbi:hypothetical protein ABZ319_03375 [Nocardia sp. NPDC005978]|uniref:hypothetical protein n=1 Tax=Nocardia sp. NPDC005978 TaxID=3156725 RepID=UPI0033AAFE4E